jgi:hypothetical protein
MPIDDPQKKSKSGYLDLVRDPETGILKTVKVEPDTVDPNSVLDTVF